MTVKKVLRSAGLASLAAALALPVWTTGISFVPAVFADSISCNLSQYKATPGLTAAVEQDALVVAWTGQGGADLRARYAIDGGQPVVRELAVKKPGGSWTAVGRNLTPEYHVVSGV